MTYSTNEGCDSLVRDVGGDPRLMVFKTSQVAQNLLKKGRTARVEGVVLSKGECSSTTQAFRQGRGVEGVLLSKGECSSTTQAFRQGRVCVHH